MATISSATYGRSQAGLQTVKQNLSSQCSKMQNALKGAEYNTLINTIRKYWAGVDAEDWIADLNAQISKTSSEIKKVSTHAQSILDTDYSNFKKFQKKNVK